MVSLPSVRGDPCREYEEHIVEVRHTLRAVGTGSGQLKMLKGSQQPELYSM